MEGRNAWDLVERGLWKGGYSKMQKSEKTKKERRNN